MEFKRIKELRIEHKLTQKEVAKKIGISLTSYSLYESGKRKVPVPIFIKLAELYDTSIDYIVEDTYQKIRHPKPEPLEENPTKEEIKQE